MKWRIACGLVIGLILGVWFREAYVWFHPLADCVKLYGKIIDGSKTEGLFCRNGFMVIVGMPGPG